MATIDHRLLTDLDPEPVGVEGADRVGPALVIVDHAGRAIPHALGALGVSAEDLDRHIAWDIGALAVAKLVADALSSPLIYQRFSRLVIDCNRRPTAPDSIPTVSEFTSVSGNIALSAEDRRRRFEAIFAPYHTAIAGSLDRWQGDPPIVVAIHSFTPVYKGVSRPMHIGVLYGEDRRFAALVLEALQSQLGDKVADNQPYRVDMAVDYSIPVHAEARKLAYVEIELRQDLLATDAGVETWARILTQALTSAIAKHKAQTGV
jgi:predicted N-formylglutamate amidohydrolase